MGRQPDLQHLYRISLAERAYDGARQKCDEVAVSGQLIAQRNRERRYHEGGYVQSALFECIGDEGAAPGIDRGNDKFSADQLSEVELAAPRPLAPLADHEEVGIVEQELHVQFVGVSVRRFVPPTSKH